MPSDLFWPENQLKLCIFKVLAVGGIKEKILAAKRAEIKKVFLPVDCLNEFNKLDDVIKEEIEIVFVKEYREIQDQLFAATDF